MTKMATATPNQIERKILDLCKQRGIEPARMNEALHRRLTLQAYRELGQGGKAITNAIVSRTRVAFGNRVSKEVEKENKQFCKRCPHDKFGHLKDGIVYCMACGCSGKFLESKWRDPSKHCPLTVNGKRCDFAGKHSPNDPEDPPCWDNRGKGFTKEKQEEPVDLDSVREEHNATN